MTLYRGSCHCGKVQFEVDFDLANVTVCNCSICRRKGSIHAPASVTELTLIKGAEALQEYRFGTGKALHTFCKTCGIHPFHRPRLDPGRWTVNLRCLQNLDLDELHPDLFDGKNWK